MIDLSDRRGRCRWTIERTGAWLGGWRRLQIRYERDSERFYSLVLLACSSTQRAPPTAPVAVPDPYLREERRLVPAST